MTKKRCGLCFCYNIFYCWTFISYLQQIKNCIKLVVACSSAELQSVHTRFWLLCMHIFKFVIVGSSSPICPSFKTEKNLTLACSSAELQSLMHQPPDQQTNQLMPSENHTKLSYAQLRINWATCNIINI